MIRALEPLSEARRLGRLAGVTAARIGSVTLLMDSPNDPHNVAAALRSCDAFGVPELNVIPSEQPFSFGRKVSQGTERWVETVLHETSDAAVAALTARGFALVATHPKGELVPEDLAGIDRVCLVFGNETEGIGATLAAAASRAVRVPMRGFVESLNLSVAAALLVRAATAGREGDLSEEERRRLYAAGLLRSVPRAEEVLGALRPA